MITRLLAFIPAPWLAVLKELPWRLIGYVAVAAAIALFVWRVLVWHDVYKTAKADLKAAHAALADERSCLKGTACAKRLVDLQRDGEKAVADARVAAQKASAKEQAKRDAEAATEAGRLLAAASVAAGRESAWRRKYEAAIAVPGSDCSTWSQEVVPCPIAD